jgi:hypothetical protein
MAVRYDFLGAPTGPSPKRHGVGAVSVLQEAVYYSILDDIQQSNVAIKIRLVRKIFGN